MMSTVNSEDLTKLAVGKRGMRRQRVNRALLAKMLRERSESDEAEEDVEGDEGTSEEDEGKLVRARIGSRVLRRRRIRNLVLAHLLRERAGGEEVEEGEEGDFEDTDEETGDDDNRLVRAVIGSRILRRRRTRKLVLAHLLRQRASGEEEEGDEDFDEEGGDEDNRLVKAVIASRVLRRRRTRKLILAHIARQRGESEEEGDEEFDEEGGEGGEEDNRLVKALIASRVLRRRRARKLILAHIARQRGEDTGEEDFEEEDFGDEGGEDEGSLVRALIGSRVLRRRKARKLLLTHLLRQREEVA